MKLEKELKLKQPLASLNHEALLSLVRTSTLILKLSNRFFSKFDLTDVQFNILMILKEHGNEGLSQQELSEQLVVGKSNVVGLVDRLERAGYVKRTSHPSDRRYNQIVLAPKGAKLEQRVEQSYFREVDRLMNVLTGTEKKVLIHAMEKIRQFILTSEI